jgi:hypothetical protein
MHSVPSLRHSMPGAGKSLRAERTDFSRAAGPGPITLSAYSPKIGTADMGLLTARRRPPSAASLPAALEDLSNPLLAALNSLNANVLVADPSALPRTAVFSFGGVTLRTMINAITESAGVRHGYIARPASPTRSR